MRAIGAAFRSLFFVALLGAITSAIAAAYARSRMLSRGAPGDDDLDLVAIYTGLDFQSEASGLRHARFTAWYGGGTLDLRGAALDPEGATLEVRAIFGGIRLVVPETWQVRIDVQPVFGGVGDARDQARIHDAGPTLRIVGWAIFGGVGIVADAPDLDREDEIEAPELAATPA